MRNVPPEFVTELRTFLRHYLDSEPLVVHFVTWATGKVTIAEADWDLEGFVFPGDPTEQMSPDHSKGPVLHVMLLTLVTQQPLKQKMRRKLDADCPKRSYTEQRNIQRVIDSLKAQQRDSDDED